MGLDWRPFNKPFEGKEREYEDLFLTLSGEKKQKSSFKDRLVGKKKKSQEELLEPMKVPMNGQNLTLKTDLTKV